MIEESVVFDKHLNETVDCIISNNGIDYSKKALGHQAESLLNQYAHNSATCKSRSNPTGRFLQK